MGANIVFAVDRFSDPAGESCPQQRSTREPSDWRSRQSKQSTPNCLIDLITHLLHLQRIANPRLRPLHPGTERVVPRADEVRANCLLLEANLWKGGCRCGSSISEQRLDLLIGRVTRAIERAGATAATRRESGNALKLLLIALADLVDIGLKGRGSIRLVSAQYGIQEVRARVDIRRARIEICVTGRNLARGVGGGLTRCSRKGILVVFCGLTGSERRNTPPPCYNLQHTKCRVTSSAPPQGRPSY